MREISQEIPLVGGLTPENYRRLNTGLFSTALNVIARKGHLEPVPPIIHPGSTPVSWPFPQVFRSSWGNLLFEETGVSLLDSGWSPTPLSFQNSSNPGGAPFSIGAGGGPWHFADFHGSWYATNGKDLLWTSAIPEYHGESNSLFGTNNLPVNSVANFRGIPVFGGFTPAKVWGSNFSAMFETWLGQQESDESWEKSYDDHDQNWVMWGSIGGGDFPQWLVFPPNYSYDLTPDSEWFLDKALENTFGWIPMIWKGPVLRVLPLGNNLIVYGKQGITALKFDAGRTVVQASPTFGVQDLMMEGIPTGTCCWGDDKVHLFIDNFSEVWLIDESLKLQRVGYGHHINLLTRSEVVVSQDPLRGAFYISDGVMTFVLGGGGLTEQAKAPTSLFRLDGELYGPFTFNPTYEGVATRLTSNGDTRVTSTVDTRVTADTEDIILATAETDFKYRGIKSVRQLQLPVWDWRNTWVKIEFTYDGLNYQDTGWLPVGPEGVSRFAASGVSFRFYVKFATLGPVDISYVRASFHRTDARFVRGPDALTASA